MQLEHEFPVSAPVDEAWPLLLDLQRIAPCLPGVTVDAVEGEEFVGRLKLRIGPVTVTYRGTARITERNEQAHAFVLTATGSESRGSGTANATVRARLQDDGASTKVAVITDVDVTGRLGDTGHSLLHEVVGKLFSRFAGCLAEELAGAAAGSAAAPGVAAGVGAGPTAASTEASTEGPTEPLGSEAPPAYEADRAAWPAQLAAPDRSRPTPNTIDLLETAGPPLLKRAVPLAAALLALLLLWRRHRRSAARAGTGD